MKSIDVSQRVSKYHNSPPYFSEYLKYQELNTSMYVSTRRREGEGRMSVNLDDDWKVHFFIRSPCILTNPAVLAQSREAEEA